MADVPEVLPTPSHLWDEGYGADDISEEVHLKTVDRFRRTANGDPVVVFTDGSTLTFFAPLQRGSVHIPLSVLYREKAARGRPVPADRLKRRWTAEELVNEPYDPEQACQRTDGNVQRDAPMPRRSPTRTSRPAKDNPPSRPSKGANSRPSPQAGSPTPRKRPSRNRG